MDSSTVLQHPRRNLGNRYRSQAARFVKLANKDPSRQDENLAWAEQNAQQSAEQHAAQKYPKMVPKQV